MGTKIGPSAVGARLWMIVLGVCPVVAALTLLVGSDLRREVSGFLRMHFWQTLVPLPPSTCLPSCWSEDLQIILSAVVIVLVLVPFLLGASGRIGAFAGLRLPEDPRRLALEPVSGDYGWRLFCTVLLIVATAPLFLIVTGRGAQRLLIDVVWIATSSLHLYLWGVAGVLLRRAVGGR